MIFNIGLMVIGKAAICIMLKDNTPAGIPSFWWLMFSDSALGEIYNVFTFVPTAVCYSKMIPNNIESTVFALLTGLNVFANFFVNKMFGNFINRFVGVTKDNLEDLYTLYIISLIFALVPLTFIPILPTKEDIKNCQNVTKFKDEYGMVDHSGQGAQEGSDKNEKIDFEAAKGTTASPRK